LLREKIKYGKCQRRSAFKQENLSISGEESAGLTFGLPRHPLEDVQAKKKHP